MAARLAPLAKGELAAVSVEADPRPAPALAFQGPDGTPTSLAAFRGRTVLLNLWATWCIPCVVELPESTLLVPRGWAGVVDETGTIHIRTQ